MQSESLLLLVTCSFFDSHCHRHPGRAAIGQLVRINITAKQQGKATVLRFLLSECYKQKRKPAHLIRSGGRNRENRQKLGIFNVSKKICLKGLLILRVFSPHHTPDLCHPHPNILWLPEVWEVNPFYYWKLGLTTKFRQEFTQELSKGSILAAWVH